MKHLYFIILLTLCSCSEAQNPTTFSKEALSDVMIGIDGSKTNFSKIIEKFKGKKVVIEIWASWCGDCIKGMPKVKSLQKEYSEVVYLFLSVDKDIASWKRGVRKYELKGEHYFLPGGWDSDFNEFIDLSWIPRYMVVDTIGEIQLFKAIKASDKKLEISIKGEYK